MVVYVLIAALTATALVPIVLTMGFDAARGATKIVFALAWALVISIGTGVWAYAVYRYRWFHIGTLSVAVPILVACLNALFAYGALKASEQTGSDSEGGADTKSTGSGG